MSNDAKDQAKAAAVFRETVDLLEDRKFDYAVGGGLATDHWTGGATTIADIDLVIREEDAPKMMEALTSVGHTATEMVHPWLHKTFKDDVTLDLMVELKNGTRFDELFEDHRKRGEMFGARPFVMAPEDQVAALAGTVDRETIGQHWYSMIDIMANNDLDWDYLLIRSQSVPLRMLSVVHFALSEQVPIRKGVLEDLAGSAASERR